MLYMHSGDNDNDNVEIQSSESIGLNLIKFDTRHDRVWVFRVRRIRVYKILI